MIGHSCIIHHPRLGLNKQITISSYGKIIENDPKKNSMIRWTSLGVLLLLSFFKMDIKKLAHRHIVTYICFNNKLFFKTVLIHQLSSHVLYRFVKLCHLALEVLFMRPKFLQIPESVVHRASPNYRFSSNQLATSVPLHFRERSYVPVRRGETAVMKSIYTIRESDVRRAPLPSDLNANPLCYQWLRTLHDMLENQNTLWE